MTVLTSAPTTIASGTRASPGSPRAGRRRRFATWAFLIRDGEICDARYHKACGGMTEDYATCWEERTVPYLSHISDAPPAPRPGANGGGCGK